MDEEQLAREGPVTFADFVSEVDYFSRLVWQSIERKEEPDAEQVKYLTESCVELLEFQGYKINKVGNIMIDVGIPPRAESLEIMSIEDTSTDLACFEAGYRHCLAVLSRRYRTGDKPEELLASVNSFVDDHFPDIKKMVPPAEKGGE